MKEVACQILQQIDNLINNVERNNLTNEQWFINFEDELNERSVRY